MTIRIFAQGTVKREDRAAFADIVNYLVGKVRATEAGKTLVYDFYLSDSDEPGNCTIFEAYVDGAAFAEHFNNLGADFPRVTQVFRTDMMRVSGEVSPALIEALSAIGDMQHHPHMLVAI